MHTNNTKHTLQKNITVKHNGNYSVIVETSFLQKMFEFLRNYLKNWATSFKEYSRNKSKVVIQQFKL